MPRIIRLVLFVALIGVSTRCFAADRQLWVYCPTNLLVDANIDKLDALWKRAHVAGYTHVLLEDSKLSRLDLLGSNTKHYQANVKRMLQVAADDGMTIIPAVFPVGYSNDILSHDPNLAEGLPVKDTPFVVHNDMANVAVDRAVSLNRISFKDDTVHIDGNTATVAPMRGNGRFAFHLTLPRFRCYHVSVDIKTQGFSGDARINPVAGDQALNYQKLGLKPTQDWTKVDAVFDTLDHDDVTLYFGIWGGSRGTLQWRNWKIDEAGLVNVLRRDGTPCVVTAGDRTLIEGTDYDPISDPLLGNKPWPGEYTSWHQPAAIHTHHLPDGTKLSVSWFYPPLVYDGEVNICLGEPATQKLFADQARMVKDAFHSPGYMINFDEIRCMNWDDICQAKHQDPGAQLAKSLIDCTKLIEPATAYTWSDMFDPYHNAHDNYYLVRGSLANSWAGLSKNAVIFNWNFGQRDKSLKFFADRGNRQIIAGYYDSDLKDLKQWLDSARNVSGVIGTMHTTWGQNYSQLEAFAKMCRDE